MIKRLLSKILSPIVIKTAALVLTVYLIAYVGGNIYSQMTLIEEYKIEKSIPTFKIYALPPSDTTIKNTKKQTQPRIIKIKPHTITMVKPSPKPLPVSTPISDDYFSK